MLSFRKLEIGKRKPFSNLALAAPNEPEYGMEVVLSVEEFMKHDNRYDNRMNAYYNLLYGKIGRILRHWQK